MAAAVGWLWHLVPRSHAGPARPPGVGGRTGRVPQSHLGGQGHSSVLVPAVVWVIIAVLAVVAAAWFLVRNVPSRIRWRPKLSRDPAVDEERSSLFSWGHLWSQLRGALVALAPPPAARPPRPRRRRRRASGEEAELASVRQAYRGLLVTARATGRGRMTSETAHELESRLSAELTPAPADALRELTFLYHDVRYGAAHPAESAHVAARGAVGHGPGRAGGDGGRGQPCAADHPGQAADFPEHAAQTAGVWDALADWWDEAIGGGNATQDLLVEPTQERLLDLQPGEAVLDIACGAGRFTRRMAARGAEVVAFDHSERFIARARHHTPPELVPRIDYRIQSADDTSALLALGEGRFDAAVCTMGLMDMARHHSGPLAIAPSPGA